jgi:uncharacterized membrane protein SirB2
MAAWYLQIKWLHITCAILSGSLFATRGAMMLAGWRAANHAALRYLSYAIDTTLLTAALMLVVIVHQYPFVQSWLTVKVLALVVYVVLGVHALRRGRTRRARAVYFLAALAVFGFIVSVAVAHSPYGIFAYLLR